MLLFLWFCIAHNLHYVKLYPLRQRFNLGFRLFSGICYRFYQQFESHLGDTFLSHGSLQFVTAIY